MSYPDQPEQVITSYQARILRRLARLLGDKIELLDNQLDELMADPGYGEIVIRVHDHRVQVIQVMFTYK